MPGKGINIIGRVGDLHDADGHGQGRILETGQKFGGERWQDQSQGEGGDHVTVDLNGRQSGGVGGAVLIPWNRHQAGAKLFRDPGGRVGAQRHHPGPEGIVGHVVVQPRLGRFGQQQRRGEVPEKELDQKRGVAKDLHIGAAHEPGETQGQDPAKAHGQAQHQGDEPCQQGELERRQDPLDEHAAIGIPPQNAPVECIVQNPHGRKPVASVLKDS
ncbi:hypothetical protein DESC_590005 [Desulfosarcina cetonica]|nr:hypothetical protein DESC_590005 [Desulfosarcina cetonica]